ncbi:PRA1 family protein B4-like [Brassica rapa]|uniref:PRA1 family protein B4-like n=1 Tax=Brassica campestris TaxID=3711 RepID=UPI00142DBE52|nr:PRA1 family protein B4-like [Brassica rapa]
MEGRKYDNYKLGYIPSLCSLTCHAIFFDSFKFNLLSQTCQTLPDNGFHVTTNPPNLHLSNYSYFKVNYLAVATAIVGFSLVTHPFSLAFLLCLLASWLFFYLLRPSDHPVVVFGRTFSDMETLGCLILFSVFVVFLTDVGSVLVSAVMVGVALVCAHGAFRAPEDLFLDEQETAATGFLSFLGNASYSAAPAVVAARA